jgi:uncharacterized membrane protein
MDRRPISTQTRQWLSQEVDVWRSSGIVSGEQSGAILDLYDTPAELAQQKRSLALLALSALAAVMVSLAVLLVIGYNWEAMPAAAKLAIIFAGLLGLHAGGFWLRCFTPWRTASEVVFLLACIMYGAAIWLIAQVFHIQSHYPDGIWVWALGVLVFALCMDTPLLHMLYAGLLALWVGCEILGFTDVDRLFFGWWHAHHGAYTLPLLALPGFLWAYRKRSPTAIALYAPLLAWWAVLQPVAWHWEVDPVFFVGLAGALMLLAAESHRTGSPMAKPYRACGILIAGGALVPLSFADFLAGSVRAYSAAYGYVAGLIFALVGAVATLGVVLFQQREAGADSHRRPPFARLLARQWLPLGLVALMAGLCFWSGLASLPAYGLEKWSPEVLLPMAVVNLAMITFALWLMRSGLREDDGRVFAIGVLYFLLWATLRYIDLFAGVGGMLGAAAMFLLCGVGLFLVARFWQHRKETGNV